MKDLTLVITNEVQQSHTIKIKIKNKQNKETSTNFLERQRGIIFRG
jgi:hypothetical protein